MHSRIYEGQVSHGRGAPVKHAFRYRVFMAYLDLAELDEVFAGRWLWSTRRRTVARFDRRDHVSQARAVVAEEHRDVFARVHAVSRGRRGR